jgi:hypothetical protein
MLYGARVTVCSEINTVRQSVKFLNAKAVGDWRNQQAVKGSKVDLLMVKY